MASANKTPNLNLPQWVGTEKPERTDFNASFDAIDTTVASHLAENAIDAHDVIPAARLHKDNQQSIPNATWTTIAFNVVDFDTDNLMSSGKFVINTAGVYLITGGASILSATTGFVSLRCIVNGIAIGSTVINLQSGGASDTQYSNMYKLNAGDIVELQVYQTTGVSRNTTSAVPQTPVFSIVKVG